MSPPPSLSEEEWFALELFLERDVRDRTRCESAFWEDTFANDHQLPDTYKRLAWLGDRVLNLVLADRRELEEPSTRRWGQITPLQAQEQQGAVAADIVRGWPPEIVALLRLGRAKQGFAGDRILGTYAEAVVGVVFREHGYDAASAFVCRHWGFLAREA